MSAIMKPGSRDYQDMVIYAFRYCLGRRTYCTQTCADHLIEHWDDLENSAKNIIIREIEYAISKNYAGDRCDIDNWKRVLQKAERLLP